ncbi:hypothetical protein ACIRG5_25895 [Lentzea sp. NPDC102401]|uniref:hypothetical protein n=1 Tax=Lentzea sp. NPDC102401 TaxID=3364128 RepID=UPI003811F662
MSNPESVVASCAVALHGEWSLGFPAGAQIDGRLFVTTNAIVVNCDDGTGEISFPLGNLLAPVWRTAGFPGFSMGAVEMRRIDDQKAFYLLLMTDTREAHRIHTVITQVWHTYYQQRASRPGLGRLAPSTLDVVHAQISRYFEASRSRLGLPPAGFPVHVQVAPTPHCLVVEVVAVAGYGVRLDRATPTALAELAAVGGDSSALLRVVPVDGRYNLVATSAITAHPLLLTDLDEAVRAVVARAKAAAPLVAVLGGISAASADASSPTTTPDPTELPLPANEESTLLRVLTTVESLGVPVSDYRWSAMSGEFCAGPFTINLRCGPVAVVTLRLLLGETSTAALSSTSVWELVGPQSGPVRLACVKSLGSDSVWLVRSADVAVCEPAGNNIITTMELLATPNAAIDSLRVRLGCR